MYCTYLDEQVTIDALTVQFQHITKLSSQWIAAAGENQLTTMTITQKVYHMQYRIFSLLGAFHL